MLSDAVCIELLNEENTYADRVALSQKIEGKDLMSIMFTSDEKTEVNRILRVQLKMPIRLN
jgi:hypothetical protein